MLDFSCLPHYAWLDVPVWVFDLEREANRWANAAALTLWNADSEAEFLARDMSDMSEAARLRLQRCLAEHAQGKVVREHWTLYPKGRPVASSLQSRGILDPEGRLVMLFAADPGSSHVDQDMLRGIEALQHTSVRIAMFNLRDGAGLMANPAAMATFGAEQGQFSELKFPALFEDAGLASRILNQVKRGQTFSADLELRTRHGLRWHGLDARPMLDPVTGERVMQLNARDISELKATQAMLENARVAAEAASQAKSSFLAHMSHEIRTPMNGVLGLTELVLQTELDERQRKFIELAHASAKGLMVIINDLLDVAKVEAGRIVVDSTPFSLHACLREALHPLLLQAHNRGIRLQVLVQPGVADELLGDALRLRQVLINLVGNALKFTEQGEVRVEVELIEDLPAEGAQDLAPATATIELPAPRQRLRFSVHDTGIGMTKEQAQQVFAPFIQADSSITRRYGGTGLGLTIVHRLVQLMGGQIEVESMPGVGSCFSFELTLPRAAQAPVPTPDEASRPDPTRSVPPQSGQQNA